MRQIAKQMGVLVDQIRKLEEKQRGENWFSTSNSLTWQKKRPSTLPQWQAALSNITTRVGDTILISVTQPMSAISTPREGSDDTATAWCHCNTSIDSLALCKFRPQQHKTALSRQPSIGDTDDQELETGGSSRSSTKQQHPCSACDQQEKERRQDTQWL